MNKPKWILKEITKNSLNELNEYILEKQIQPSSVLEYHTFYEALKQQMRYSLTYWALQSSSTDQ